MLRSVSCVVLAIGTLLLAGCDARIEHFEPNLVYSLALSKSRSVPAEAASEDSTEVLRQLFGTPNEPKWPLELLAGTAAESLVDPRNLERAAGAVSSEKDGTHLGLFRENCVVCHGLEGSGAGPASQFQDPYPRDFRHGVFKWKSTERGAKPTKADLRRLIRSGIPGTGMPAFSLLAPDDLDALVDYVIYLSVRGEVERRILMGALDELDYGESQPEEELRLVYPGATEGSDFVEESVVRVANRWAEANENVTDVPEHPELSESELAASVDRGKNIFHGQIANCVGCHGANGLGNLPTLDFDDWTKDYTTKIGVTPSDREAVRPFRDVGALRPRPIKPRNLQDGVFHGGGDAESLYHRITQGIAGTPMPSVQLVEEENGKGLTASQIWDLVHYVQSLGDD